MTKNAKWPGRVVEDADLVPNNKDLLQRNKKHIRSSLFSKLSFFSWRKLCQWCDALLFSGSKIKIHQSSHSSKWQLLTLASSWTFVAYKVWGCERITFFDLGEIASNTKPLVRIAWTYVVMHIQLSVLLQVPVAALIVLWQNWSVFSETTDVAHPLPIERAKLESLSSQKLLLDPCDFCEKHCQHSEGRLSFTTKDPRISTANSSLMRGDAFVRPTASHISWVAVLTFAAETCAQRPPRVFFSRLSWIRFGGCSQDAKKAHWVRSVPWRRKPWRLKGSVGAQCRKA